MNNLRKFATEAEYSAATLSYPAVSWVTSGDTLHYDLSGGTPPTPQNDKLMLAFTDSQTSSSRDVVYANCGASMPDYHGITNITINDVEVPTSGCTADVYLSQNELCLIKYTLSRTEIPDCFTGDLGGWGSEGGTVDVLIPSQITEINHLPSNAANLVIEATTPPTTNLNQSAFGHRVYVPDSALSAYQNDTSWGDWGSLLKPISEYSGDLPV